MTNPVVLILSATSRTGRHDVFQLLALLAQAKFTIRLAARDPSKLHDLHSKGAQTIAVDPTSLESMTQACTGVEFAYLVLPSLVDDCVNATTDVL